jgi:outer membrane protein TolC
MFSPRFLLCLLLTARFAFAAPSPKSAPPAELHLTLRKAIALAIENNLAIKVGEFEPDIAAARITSELGAFDPALRAYANRNVFNSASGENDYGAYGLGLGGKSVYGTDYQLGLATTGGSNSRFPNLYSSGAQFALTQPLLRGFGSDVNLAALRIARNNRQISEWAFKQEIIDVVTQTVFVYNELYSALRNYEAARHSRDLALELCKQEETRAEIGVKIELDVVTAQAEAASREEAVILAKNDIENNERYLKQLITSDTEKLLAMRISIEPPPIAAIGGVDLPAGLRAALGERPDYRQALISLQTRHINVVTARNSALPRLDLVGSLNLIGLDSNDISESLSFWNNRGGNPQNWSIGTVFSLPIPNRGARGQLKAARLIDAQALIGLKQLEQSIIVNVANAAGQIETARKRIDSTQEALRLAKESLDAGRKRHEFGSATTFEVLQLQKAMTDAQAALIRAEADYHKAISEYDRQTGQTLRQNGIEVSN